MSLPIGGGRKIASLLVLVLVGLVVLEQWAPAGSPEARFASPASIAVAVVIALLMIRIKLRERKP